MKKFIWSVLNALRVGGAVQLFLAGYLHETGWLKSFHSKKSVDASGNPIPWISYPCIYFLENRLKKEMQVFEYGAGNSTRWYAQRVKSIISVENDQKWIEILEEQELPANASLLYREVNRGYAEAISDYDYFFDMVVIDGRNRNACVLNSIPKLSASGVILFDNSHLKEYQSSYDLLIQTGFRRIDFWGLTPIVALQNCTTIFYRDENVLGI